MASITKKGIIDDITILLTKFGRTDDSRLDDDYLSYKIDDVRAVLITDRYKENKEMDSSWLQDLGMVAFTKVNYADDSSVIGCDCPISKAFIPQILSLSLNNGNQDLGLYNVLSSCGKTGYYPYELSKWRMLTPDTERSKFHYYSRVNNALYVNKVTDNLRIIAVLRNPTDGFVKSSLPVASGSIVSGTVYIVKYGQVVYNGVTYQPDETFTGTAATAFFTSIGKVYLDSQARAFVDTDPYPVSADMPRQIVIEILTKEFQIEKQSVIDMMNDSKDDAQKV